MLPTQNRLAKKRDFDLLFKYGRWERTPLLSIKSLVLAQKRKYFPKKENFDNYEKQLRIAVSVGLKFSKKAVERNRMKRQLQEIVREFLKGSQLKSGYYIMIMPEKKLSERSFAEIRQELELLLNKINIFSS
jgi:ribonuclease P protein component